MAAVKTALRWTPPGTRDDPSCCAFCLPSLRTRAGSAAILLLLATAGLVLTTLRISASRLSPARVPQHASPGKAEAETDSPRDCSCYSPCPPSESPGGGGGGGATGAVAPSLLLQNIPPSTGATFSWSQPTQPPLTPSPLWLANDSLHKQHFVFQCVAANAACGRQGAASPPIIVVVVFSAPANVDRRSAIRRTWASEAAATAAHVVFLLTDTADESLRQRVRAESAAHGDLLVTTGAPDAYDMLTVKSVAMLQWARDACPRAHYLVKADDDVYLSLSHLAAVLPGGRGGGPPQRLMMGSRRSGLKVISDPAHKWYNPLYLRYYGATYPTYLSGTAYVVAMSLVTQLHAAALRLPFDLMEDVFVTGVCADRTLPGRALRVHHRGFSIYRREPCEFARPDAITAHDMSPDDMLAVWTTLRSGRCGR